MIDPEVEKHRKLGIAASDAAPIAGLSPYKTAADIWIEKKHPELLEKDKEEEPELYWGTMHEPMILAEYAKRTGQKLEKIGLQRNAKIEWLMCQPDAGIVGKKKGAEAKTSGSYNHSQWGPIGTDIVPVEHMIQCQHSMMVTGWREWDVCALIGGNDFRIYHLFWNHDLIKELFEIEREFYVDFIAGSLTPPIDWGKNIQRFVRNKWKCEKPGTKLSVDDNGDEVLKRAIKSLLRAREDFDASEKAEDIAATTIQSYMQANETLRWDEIDLTITWKKVKDSTKVDREKMLEELLPHVVLPPEQKEAIIKKHTKTVDGVRRFLPKDKRAAKKGDQHG